MERIAFAALQGAGLVVDAVYCGGAQKNVRADPLQHLLPVGNQGGFRISGARPRPRLVALFMTGQVKHWPDQLDETTGMVTYYGDNRHAGSALHDTPRGGNQVLRDTFTAMHGSRSERAQLPIYLVFEATGAGRDVRFRGLAVPGAPALESDEELIAIWRTEDGQRFQNYRATFTVLDEPIVSRAWIDDVLAGRPLSGNAPRAWMDWVASLRYRPLAAPSITPVRSRQEQLPPSDDKAGWKLLTSLYRAYEPNPFRFERVAVDLAQLALPLPLRLEVTRPVVDGGRDAVGGLALGVAADPVWITLALEAKCYDPRRRGVGVREMSRLISRLRYRDVGVLVTTSYVGRQAYQEIRDDQHPVVVLSGGDIVRELRRKGINDSKRLDEWMQRSA